MRTGEVQTVIPFRLLQMIQRQLQQVEVKQRELEERGVMVEKALRGEAGEPGGRTHLNTNPEHTPGFK